MLSTWFVVALPFAFVCLFLFVLPHLSRRTQFFSVTVSPDFRDGAEAHAIVNKYRKHFAVHCAIGLAAYVLGIAQSAQGWLLLAFFWPVIGSLLAVAAAHRAALRFAAPTSSVREASLQPRRAGMAGGGWPWIGPFVILAVAGAFIGSHWPEIPARFPIHWGFDGQPNGWAVRSFAGVYTPLLIGCFVCLILLLMARNIAMNARGSAAMRSVTTRMLTALGYFVAVLFGWLGAALPLGYGGGQWSLGIIIGCVALIIGATIVLGIKAKAEPEPDGTPGRSVPSILGSGDNASDRHWIGGLIYFNPDDPAMFVEKRIGIGYGLNFGNARSWIVLAGVVLIPIVLALTTKS